MLRQRLDQRQVQKLILAPALQQAIKLLQLTNLELIEVIDEELSGNPMIELEEEGLEKGMKEASPGAEADQEFKPAGEPALGRENPENEPPLQDANALDVESRFQDYLDDGFRPNFSEKRDAISLENTLSRSPSLWDHLNWQAGLTFFDETEREIAQFIIGNINEDGYLGSSIEEIARLCQAGPEKVDSHPRKDQDRSTRLGREASTSRRPS